jgi:phosphoglycolate phosphatase
MTREPLTCGGNGGPLSLVVFDWDGTLVDSIDKIVEAVWHAADCCGLSRPARASVRDIIGLSLETALSELFGDLPQDMLHRRLMPAYKEAFVALDQVPCGLHDGALDLLAELKRQGMGLAVATGKSRRGLERAMAQQASLPPFDATICADESRGKPAPDMLLTLAERLGTAPESMLMIGDTSHDLKMAANAGVWGVGITHGAHGPDRLMESKPLAIVDHLTDILEVIDGLGHKAADPVPRSSTW